MNSRASSPLARPHKTTKPEPGTNQNAATKRPSRVIAAITAAATRDWLSLDQPCAAPALGRLRRRDSQRRVGDRDSKAPANKEQANSPQFWLNSRVLPSTAPFPQGLGPRVPNLPWCLNARGSAVTLTGNQLSQALTLRRQSRQPMTVPTSRNVMASTCCQAAISMILCTRP